MFIRHCAAVACAAVCALGYTASIARGHGFVGDRFFPPTLTTDDPFATDELSLPQINYFKNAAGDGDPTSTEVSAGFEFDKEIFPRFSFGVADDYIWQNPIGQTQLRGWDDVTLLTKYQLWQSDPHEVIISVGLETDLGGTGSKAVSDSFTTFVPTFYFGKGFGDLPEKLNALKPLAITGTIGQTLPTSAAAPNALECGFALEYSLPYLQQSVDDIGLPHPFSDMIPLVEFNLQTPENRGAGGSTTGTINPGVLWETRYFQLGAEAEIPLNGLTGKHVGAVLSVQLYIDDLFPKIFGHPLFGE